MSWKISTMQSRQEAQRNRHQLQETTSEGTGVCACGRVKPMDMLYDIRAVPLRDVPGVLSHEDIYACDVCLGKLERHLGHATLYAVLGAPVEQLVLHARQDRYLSRVMSPPGSRSPVDDASRKA